MRASGQCPKCACTTMWHVRDMQEHASVAPWPLRGDVMTSLGLEDGVAPLDVYICSDCGLTSWYSRVADRILPERGRIRSLIEASLACTDCIGRAHFLVAELREFDEVVAQRAPLHVHGGTVGRFAVLICAGCGRCEWFAWGDLGEPIFVDKPHACVRCGAHEHRRIPVVKEASGAALPVGMSRDVPVGHFAISVCEGCGVTEWFARDTNKLRADGDRVMRVEGTKRARVTMPPAGGPYR